MAAPLLGRREMLTLSAAGAVSFSFSGWMKALADATANNPQRRKACILLWMNGGPSQMDTFDLKPGHANAGPYKSIETAGPGLRISKHLPKLAPRMEDVLLARSTSTKEGDPGRASSHRRTGHTPQ